MMFSAKRLGGIASIFGLTGVGLGAFGAHALKPVLSPEMFSVFETGVRYQMYHTFALFVTAWAFQKTGGGKFRLAAWLFSVGILLFSGSLYVLAATGIAWVGFVTPLGGLMFLGGWGMLVFGFWKTRPDEF